MAHESKSKLRMFGQCIRGWAYKYVGGLFMDEKNNGKKAISIGRCMLIVVLTWMFWFWSTWASFMTITPELLAQIIVVHLPVGSRGNEADMLVAAKLVIDALPTSAPPMMELAFLTACGYVFGTKVKNVVARRLDSNR